MKKSKKLKQIKDRLKSIHKANWKIEIENEIGRKSIHRIHKSKKVYSRKHKHKKQTS